MFYYVAYFKSFSKAGRHLGIVQSAVSRAIKELETALDDQLFYRDGGSINLTTKGVELFSIVEKVFREIAPLQFLLQLSKADVGGELKIVSISNFISMYLSSSLYYFMKAYPKLKVNFEEVSKGTDLLLCKESVLIYPYIENRPDLIQTFVTSFQYKLYASPAYLSRYNEPKTAEDLDNHLLIEVVHYKKNLGDINWHLKAGTLLDKRRKPSLQIDSTLGGLKFAEEGAGIISLPSNLPVLKTSNLKEILPQVSGPTMEIYCIYSRDLEEDKSVRAFGDYLKKAFKK